MKPGRHEWDEQVINSCMFPHDAREVLKIRLLQRHEEDILARHYERTGVLMVQSAYKLALAEDQEDKCQTGSSSRPDGLRPLYTEIWSVKVLAKVKVFAWSQEGLAKESNRKRRTLVRDASCQVCACEEETGYHATVRCTKASALKQEMRRSWVLPDEKQFTYTALIGFCTSWLRWMVRQKREYCS
jgi:hypothetical protein